MGARTSEAATRYPSRHASKPPPVPARLKRATRRIQQLGDDPIRAAVVTRAMCGIVEVVESLTKSELGELASAPTYYAMVVEMLERPGALAELRRQDPLMPARIRGLQTRQQLLQSEGGALTVEDVARILGLTRQGVDKRRSSGKLLGVQASRRGYLYPAWQFTESGVLPGIEPVLEALKEHDPWAKLWFFVTESSWLDGATPLEMLKKRDIDKVVAAACSYGEHGAT